MLPKHGLREGTRPASAESKRAKLTRRAVLGGMTGAVLASPWVRAAPPPVSFGLTPVVIISHLRFVEAFEGYLSRRIGRPVTLVTRRSYQDITALLLSGLLDAAWICGYPYVQNLDRLILVAVPVWRGKPKYQSYMIVGAKGAARSVGDLKGNIHAFSDPDSNSGFLVTQHLLATMGETPSTFFRKFFFTYGHRNVVRAVASGLAESGSVDGYVWEVMRELEPSYVEETRVLRKSEWLGFPPIVCPYSARYSAVTRAVWKAFVSMGEDAEGREILDLLRLDGFSTESPALFDGIASKYEYVKNFGKGVG